MGLVSPTWLLSLVASGGHGGFNPVRGHPRDLPVSHQPKVVRRWQRDANPALG